VELYCVRWTLPSDRVQSLNLAFDLVIFDCDGVHGRESRFRAARNAEILTRHGYPITPEQMLERFLGVSDREARQQSNRDLRRATSDDRSKMKGRAAVLRGRSATIPHVGAAIRRDRSAQMREASSGTPDKIRHGLTCAGLMICFAPSILLCLQVERGRPAPDLFLFAAAQCGPRARCIVIEDSIPHHRRACRRMTVLAFTRSHCRPDYDETLRAAGARVDVWRYAAIARSGSAQNRQKAGPRCWISGTIAY